MGSIGYFCTGKGLIVIKDIERLMSVLEVIPEELWHAEKEDELISFIRLYPAPLKFKKAMLVDWTRFVGIQLTRDMVERIGVND